MYLLNTCSIISALMNVPVEYMQYHQCPNECTCGIHPVSSVLLINVLRMLTSLDLDESRNLFSRSRIKFLEVEYREMTLGHTQCAWTTRSIWLPNCGWATRERRRQLPWSLVSWVACTGTVFYDTLSVFSRHLFTCTPVTQFHSTATMAYIISDCNWRWQTTSIH